MDCRVGGAASVVEAVVVGGCCAGVYVQSSGRPKSQTITLWDMADRKSIKGLRSFEMGDAEIFAQLERQDFVQECLLAIASQEYRLGVEAGESGSGKK